MPPSHLILCCPLLFLTSIFSSESVLPISWPNYWSFSFSISPFIEYSGLIFFSIASFDFFAIQGTLKSLPLHHSSKALILFFMAQISHPYMITWETIAWTIQTFVSKVTPLFFNTLSRFLIAFLPRNDCLLISWLQSPSAVILGSKKTQSLNVYNVSPCAMEGWNRMPWC